MPNKLEKFAELNTFENTFSFHHFDIPDGFSKKGKWHAEVFKNENPIVVELGCGRGEYTIGLAEHTLQKNFIGVDVKGNRIWTGARHATDHQLKNVAFLRTRIDFIDHCFSENEVSEIWITFPDPQPQKNRARKRLTNPAFFLNRYKKILKPGGLIHLKTDSTFFYDYTMEVIKENNFHLLYATHNLYKNCPEGRDELIRIKTYYEGLFTAKGEDIKYCCFQIN
ncbi:MAG: tRNA ((7)-)-methyltransferase [Bacteroidota bacterium]|jgi:tRNA (guanine-N7-)-methyltransferase|nr:tRNA ((7)-)-methyltransferase [Bacteroidota bacterium]